MDNVINAIADRLPVQRRSVDQPSSPTSNQQEVPAERADAEQTRREPEAHEVRRAAERLNEALTTLKRDIAISVHDDGKLVVKVTDPATGDVLRQIPPERILEVEENLDQIVGLFVNDLA